MSADNCIAILKTPKDNGEGFEYRVIHAQAFENIYWDDVNGYDYETPNPVMLVDYFGNEPAMTEEEAYKKADELEKDCLIVEYGVGLTDLDKPFSWFQEEAKKTKETTKPTMTKKELKLEVENCDNSIELINCRVLAIIPQEQPYSYEDQPQPHIKRCGLNVGLEFVKEPDQTKRYITDIVAKGGTVKCWIIKDDNRIPVDIHGGNVGKCYFGYINSTIFD